MVTVIALYLLLPESYETINYTLSSTITTCIQKMLKTTSIGTKYTHIIIHQQTVDDSQLCYPLCVLLWLFVAGLKVQDMQQIKFTVL